MSEVLPARPSIEYLKQFCKKRVASVRAAGKSATLSAVQLKVAREYGFSSWRTLVEFIARQKVDPLPVKAGSPLTQFLVAAVSPPADHRDGTLTQAKALLKEHPDLPKRNFFAACALGDVHEVAKWLKKDKSLAVQAGGPNGWLPLSYLCFSRFLRLEKRQSAHFVRCAELLLKAGADPNTHFINGGDGVKESALYGAAGVANDAALTRLLLSAGAEVNDGESLYHATEFADHACLKLLLEAKPPREDVSYCMNHKMDFEDSAGVKLFLKYGADPNFMIERGAFVGMRPLHFAIMRHRSTKVLRALLDAGADVNLPAKNGATPYAMACRMARKPVQTLLRKYGAIDQRSEREHFLAACATGDVPVARRMAKAHPEWFPLKDSDQELFVNAASGGSVKAIKLMLSLGWNIEAIGPWMGTPLHQAAWAGKTSAVRLLLAQGANIHHKQQWGGDALHTAIHGASHANHKNGPKIVALIAAAMGKRNWAPYLATARENNNQAVVEVLERIARE